MALSDPDSKQRAAVQHRKQILDLELAEPYRVFFYDIKLKEKKRKKIQVQL